MRPAPEPHRLETAVDGRVDGRVEDVLVAALALARAALNAEVAPGLSFPQVLVLWWLARFPGSTAGQLAEDLGVEPSGVSVALQGLAAKGLVAKVPDPRDQRRALLRVTAKGRKARAVAEESLRRWLAPSAGALRAVELEVARDVLAALGEGFNRSKAERSDADE